MRPGHGDLESDESPEGPEHQLERPGANHAGHRGEAKIASAEELRRHHAVQHEPPPPDRSVLSARRRAALRGAGRRVAPRGAWPRQVHHLRGVRSRPKVHDQLGRELLGQGASRQQLGGLGALAPWRVVLP